MFNPEYDGDTPNRQWVRRKLEEKGGEFYKIDAFKIILHMSEERVIHLFEQIITASACVRACAEGN